MTIVNKSLDWIRNHFDKDKVNKSSIVVIMIYYYVGLLSYITVPIKPIYRLFISGSSVAVVVRALMTAMMVLYCLLVVVVNKKKVEWKWAIVFSYILLLTLISTVISPQTYTYIYVESLYRVVHLEHISTGINRLLTMFLSSISDFALAFCFLFILPIVFKNKKSVLLLTSPIVVIALFECLYSLFFEKDQYISLLNLTDPEYGGYTINIGATFGNKQDWGAFINVAFMCSIVSAFLVEKKNRVSVFLKGFLLLSSIIIFIFTIASLCKTAIVSEIIGYIFLAIYAFHFFYKKNRALFICYIVVVLTFLITIVCFYVIPVFHSSGFLEKIYDVTTKYIIEKLNIGTIFGRTSIWLRVFENFRTYNFFFGLSKGGVTTYSRVVIIEGQSVIHNGFAYFFASYGLMGFSIYLLLLFIIVKRIILLIRYEVSLFFIIFACFISALIFSLSESEVLIVSGSNPIFVFNILVCVFPKGLTMNLSRRDYVG